MHLHIVTGAKGGIGRTILSLSLFLSLEDKSSILIDMNDHNSYSFDIFVKQDTIKKIEMLDMWFGKMAEGESQAYIRRIMKPINPYKLFNEHEFWESSQKIIEEAKSEKTSMLSKTENIIMDTGLHLLNLFNTSKLDDTKQLINKITGRKVKIYIWFLWTLKLINNIPGLINAETVQYPTKYDEVKSLETIFNEFEVDDVVKFIHVINPADMDDISPIRTKIIKSIPTFSKYNSIKENQARYLYSNDFIKKFDRLKEKVSDNPIKKYEAIGRKILKNQGSNNKFYNLLLIEAHDANLSEYSSSRDHKEVFNIVMKSVVFKCMKKFVEKNPLFK